ncbi:Transcription factor IIIB 60 kDa subunit Short=TFIIIB; AltName: Full=B-related factor 1; Short=BRF-1; AltName: Full=TFIIB-related factor [Serendipita indica DSM 11827]|nr:Transcription factor IIIB 60 kDa subunit Short=TFIIIB; AltName: Full=B-related factor 1; Short=BRF-1; AltName: Full=TFIIB-related factor [Serendipita indica DSM 11827]
MKTTQCSSCGGVAIGTDSTLGSTFCMDCGTVLEESNIVAEIAFLETSSGAAAVSGSLVARNATASRISGPAGRSSGMESSEITKQRSLALLRNYQQPFALPDSVISTAERHLTLAYQYSFTKGRHIEHIIAVCLYMGCLEQKTSHMLIDFADILRINVYALGSTYLKWLRTLGWKPPLLEPSIFITRFVALLEFGEDERKVADDANRIATRFKDDWIHEGRRTAGICGAAIYLAAQMNNYRRSIQEIMQVVKIADTTIIKRLEEFSATASANLTVGDFRVTEHPTEAADPPAFTRARQIEHDLALGRGSKRKRRKRSRKEMEEDDADTVVSSQPDGSRARSQSMDPNGAQLDDSMPAPESPTNERTPELVADEVLGRGIFEDIPAENPKTDLATLNDEGSGEVKDDDKVDDKDKENSEQVRRKVIADMIALDPSHVQEVQQILESEAGQEALALVRSTNNAERGEDDDDALMEEDDLTGLDEEELDAYICGEDEAQMRERVWTELNLDYLRRLAAKRIRDQSGEDPRPKKHKRKSKPKQSFTPGKTAFESVRAMAQGNRTFSKRINYNLLKETFDENKENEDGEEDVEDFKEDEKAQDDPLATDLKEWTRRMGHDGVDEDEYGDYYEQEA